MTALVNSQLIPVPGQKIILQNGDGAKFDNLVLTAKISLHRTDGPRLYVSSEGETNKFMPMSEARKNTAQAKMTDAELGENFSKGFTVANLGVSVAAVTEFKTEELRSGEGGRFAILAERKDARGRKFMLISGYTDFRNNAESQELSQSIPLGRILANHALVEFNQEALAVIHDSGEKIAFPRNTLAGPNPGLSELVLTPVRRDAGTFSKPYVPEEGLPSLAYNNRSMPVVIVSGSVHSFLPGLKHSPQAYFNDESKIPGTLVSYSETCSLQTILHLDVRYSNVRNLSLIHSETHPVPGQPGKTHEVVDPKGLILARIDPVSGLLTGETYNLSNGNLIPTGVNTDEMLLSEVFRTKTIQASGVTIPVTVPKPGEDGKLITSASFEEYLRYSHLANKNNN